MIPILQNIKSSKLMNSPRSLIYAKTGLSRTLFLNSLPQNASSLKFSKHSTHIMSLCLMMHVNLGLSLRKTAHALKELYNVTISHQQVANYCKTAAICIKPYVDRYPYEKNDVFTADETYIKIRGVKSYIWLIINAATRSILDYQVSDNRGVGPCILAMRMAFQNLKKLPEKFKFIADGYSAYPLAAMEFAKKFGNDLSFSVTRVIGQVLNEVEMLQNADNMPAKWQILIYLGQQTILDMQKNKI